MTSASQARNRSQRTVVITGAGGGLGRGITGRLLSDGFRCVLSDVLGDRLEETIDTAGPDGSRAVAVVGDLRNADYREQLMATATEQGRLYGLVNNAGVARVDPLLDESVQDWRDTLGTNLEAPYFLAQQAFEHMRLHGEGRVVNIASVYATMAFDNRGYGSRAPETTPGDRGPARQTAYAASKGGLVQLTRDLAAAVGRWGITVNAISPGTVPHGPNARQASPDLPAQNPDAKPGLGDRVDPAILAALASQVPLGRLGTVAEIAGPVSFLLSEDASYVTGMNLMVDGGWSIW